MSLPLAIGCVVFIRRNGQLFKAKVISSDASTACLQCRGEILFVPLTECVIDPELEKAVSE